MQSLAAQVNLQSLAHSDIKSLLEAESLFLVWPRKVSMFLVFILEVSMANKSDNRNWTSRIRWGTSAALALVLGVAAMAIQSARAQTFTLLYGFTGKSDGGVPQGGVIRDGRGNLYGTTSLGGLRDCHGSRCGVAFKVDTRNDKETVLHSFKGPDGEFPSGSLLLDEAGNLYGTTPGGGTYGVGVVFKLDKSGKETVLHNFKGTDGAYPLGSLVRDGTGNLYGATFAGGVGNCFMGKGCGVVFKLDKTGKETVLHAFTGGSDGGEPQGPGALIRDKAGSLYGTTVQGGTGNCNGQNDGCGVVFKLDQTGKETVLYTFTGESDGGEPLTGLALDEAGSLYGSAVLPGSGAVFMVDKAGKETVLYTFTDGSDGGYPNGGLVRDAAGNIYGTTTDGGSGDCHGAPCGVIFELDKTGKETVLYNFNGDANGFGPYAGLIRDQAGNLYGTTQFSGILANGFGTVFELIP